MESVTKRTLTAPVRMMNNGDTVILWVHTVSKQLKKMLVLRNSFYS